MFTLTPRLGYWTVVAICALDLAAAAGIAGMAFTNRAHQADAAKRQQYITQNEIFLRLRDDLVQRLANVSVQQHDGSLQTLLEQNGYRVTVRAKQPETGAQK